MMPSKIHVDENLVFLYRCLLNSDCKVIDFNAVGAATDLKTNAARMRYSRLKKNIESMIDGSSKKGSADFIKVQTTNKIKLTTTPSKKRKPMYQSEDEEYEFKTLHDEIGSVMIKDEELQEWTGTPRTRGKKIDFKDVFDTDSSTGSGLHNRHGESSDDYRMEDVSEEDEELHANEDGMEIGLPASPRRKSNSHSANKTMKRSSIIASTELSNETPRLVANNDAEETAAKPKVPVTPESGISGPRVTKKIRLNLPPRPQSTPNSPKQQEPVASSSIARKTPTGTSRLSPTPKLKKSRHATPETARLAKHVERALIRAEHNFAAQARQADKIPQVPIYDEEIHDERFLQSIGADEEEEAEHGQEDDDDDLSDLDTSSNYSSPEYHSLNTASATNGDDEADAVSEVATRTELNGSSATLSPSTPTMLWPTTTTATTPAPAIAPSSTQPAPTVMQQSPSSPPDSCIVQ